MLRSRRPPRREPRRRADVGVRVRGPAATSPASARWPPTASTCPCSTSSGCSAGWAPSASQRTSDGAADRSTPCSRRASAADAGCRRAGQPRRPTRHGPPLALPRRRRGGPGRRGDAASWTSLALRNGRARCATIGSTAAHSNAYAAWQRMGSPADPTPAQYAELERASQLATVDGTGDRARRERAGHDYVPAPAARCFTDYVVVVNRSSVYGLQFCGSGCGPEDRRLQTADRRMITITPTVAIDERDIEERFVRASGPGGQNVNKVSTAVELRYNVARAALPQRVKDRLIVAGGEPDHRRGPAAHRQPRVSNAGEEPRGGKGPADCTPASGRGPPQEAQAHETEAPGARETDRIEEAARRSEEPAREDRRGVAARYVSSAPARHSLDQRGQLIGRVLIALDVGRQLALRSITAVRDEWLNKPSSRYACTPNRPQTRVTSGTSPVESATSRDRVPIARRTRPAAPAGRGRDRTSLSAARGPCPSTSLIATLDDAEVIREPEAELRQRACRVDEIERHDLAAEDRQGHALPRLVDCISPRPQIEKQQPPSKITENTNRSREGVTLPFLFEIISHCTPKSQFVNPSVPIENDLPRIITKALRFVHPRCRDRCSELLPQSNLSRQKACIALPSTRSHLVVSF